jgi:hypothetical protein
LTRIARISANLIRVNWHNSRQSLVAERKRLKNYFAGSKVKIVKQDRPQKLRPVRMKKKSQNHQESKLLTICYDDRRKGWVIEGQHKPIFSAQTDLENYCRNKLGRIPITARPNGRYPYQDLPHSSVWTGAPWDRTFSK